MISRRITMALGGLEAGPEYPRRLAVKVGIDSNSAIYTVIEAAVTAGYVRLARFDPALGRSGNDRIYYELTEAGVAALAAHRAAIPARSSASVGPMQVTISVSNRAIVRVEAETSPRSGELLESLRKLCTHPNPAHADWKAYRSRLPWPKRGYEPSEEIRTWRETREGLSMPVGRVAEIYKVAADRGFDVAINDTRRGADFDSDGYFWKGPEPRASQEKLVYSTINAYRSGPDGRGGSGTMIWRAPGGIGKTTGVLLLVAHLGVRALITVNSLRVFRQWVKTCEACLGFTPGRIGDGHNDRGPVTICMQQSAWPRAKELATGFDLLVCDEAQGAAAQTLQKFCDANKAKYRLATSGDERRSDKREFLIYDQFGSEVIVITEAEAHAGGETMPVEVDVVMTDFEADWYVALSPDEKFKARHSLLDRMTTNDARNHLIKALLRKCELEREQVLTMTARVDHARLLHADVGSAVLLLGAAEQPKRDFERAQEEFVAGLPRAFGTYQAVGVGYESHRRLARGILATPVVSGEDSMMQFKQFIWRFARVETGKQTARVYYLLDKKVFGLKPLKWITKWVSTVRVHEDGVIMDGKNYLRAAS